MSGKLLVVSSCTAKINDNSGPSRTIFVGKLHSDYYFLRAINTAILCYAFFFSMPATVWKKRSGYAFWVDIKQTFSAKILIILPCIQIYTFETCWRLKSPVRHYFFHVCCFSTFFVTFGFNCPHSPSHFFWNSAILCSPSGTWPVLCLCDFAVPLGNGSFPSECILDQFL